MFVVTSYYSAVTCILSWFFSNCGYVACLYACKRNVLACVLCLVFVPLVCCVSICFSHSSYVGLLNANNYLSLLLVLLRFDHEGAFGYLLIFMSTFFILVIT